MKIGQRKYKIKVVIDNWEENLMKKIVKFVCLLIIAVLIAILVMKNGASAEGEPTVSIQVSSTSVQKGDTVTVTISVNGNGNDVKSYGGTLTCDGLDGERVIIQNGSESCTLRLSAGNAGTYDVSADINVTYGEDLVCQVTGNGPSITITDPDQTDDPTDPGQTDDPTYNTEQSIKLTPASLKFKVNGEPKKIESNIPVEWGTTNSNVATISTDSDTSVTVIPQQKGTCNITATDKTSGKQASVAVTVSDESEPVPDSEPNPEPNNDNNNGNNNGNNEQPSESFSISPNSSTSLIVGKSMQIKVTAGEAVSWESSKPAVASVDENGKVTAKKAGTTIITVTSSDGSTKQLQITVKSESTGNASQNKSASAANESVPSTGEAPAELLVLIGAITFIIAVAIFRKKTK